MIVESAKLVSGIRKCKRIPQTLIGFRILFITKLAYEQLKARAGIFIYSKRELKGIEMEGLNHCRRYPRTNLKTFVN